MTAPFEVSKVAVRRFLLECQGLQTGDLAKTRTATPDTVLSRMQKLECVQIDPVAAVARNQHLVLAARVPGYTPDVLEQLLREHRVFEYWANAMCVIPMEDYPLFELTRKRMSAQLQPQLDGLGAVVTDVMKRLESEGPLPSKAFDSTNRVHGYWESETAAPKTKATSHALNLLNDIGRIQVVGREGTTRFFDVRERAVPSPLLDESSRITDAECRHRLLEKYLRAYRVFHTSDARFGWQRLSASERRQAITDRISQGTVVPLQVEGVKTPYFMLAEDVERLMAHQTAITQDQTFAGSNQVQFLPPLDSLLWHRDRIEDFFGFSYTWEVYTPAVKRQFGYYAMPILAGDALIGRVDPRLDRDRMRLNVKLLQIEPHIRWTKTLGNRVVRALQQFARFHQAELGDIERVQPEGIEIH